MHVHDVRAFGLMPLLIECIQRCEVFLAEYNLNQSPDAPEELSELVRSPIAWHEQLNPKKFQKIRNSILKATGIDIQHYKHLLPFFIVQQLSVQMLPADQGMPLDLALWTYAEKAGKTLAGIESLEGQISYVRRIPMEKQVKLLLDFAKKPAALRRHYTHMIELYQAQDIYRLHKTIRKHSGYFRKVLLFERNYRMAEVIETHCRRQPTFVAVGAGHLTGGKGLLRLLKQRGIEVTPVSSGQLSEEKENRPTN